MISRDQANQSKFLQTWRILSSSKIFWITVFAILTSLSAQVAIPAKPVPFTLQTLLVLLSGALLGSRNGAYSQFLYLLMGIVGLPVFAQIPDAPLGFSRIIGPTGGYLLAFPIAAYLVGFLIEKRKKIEAEMAFQDEEDEIDEDFFLQKSQKCHFRIVIIKSLILFL